MNQSEHPQTYDTSGPIQDTPIPRKQLKRKLGLLIAAVLPASAGLFALVNDGSPASEVCVEILKGALGGALVGVILVTVRFAL